MTTKSVHDLAAEMVTLFREGLARAEALYAALAATSFEAAKEALVELAAARPGATVEVPEQPADDPAAEVPVDGGAVPAPVDDVPPTAQGDPTVPDPVSETVAAPAGAAVAPETTPEVHAAPVPQA